MRDEKRRDCYKIVKKGLVKEMQTCNPKRVSKKGKYRNNFYYLLPGMGRGARKRYWRNMAVAVIVGALFCALFAFVIWFFNNR